ncbi:MAG TPA: PRC-barrel domain-containing protein [Sphingomonas sp.]|nr:PRC-barrel domain-containing protein [Sphingomonas sp.]
MFEIAGWIAPIATMVAAVMTASNLGARVTGWGFAVFAIGAVNWIIVATGSGQQNLMLSNVFLLLVDIVGMWRWLGRRARYDEGASVAAARSANAPAPTLFALSRIEGMPVRDTAGNVIATAVEAMASRDNGAITYLVVREGGVGGVGERLHALGWNEISVEDDAMICRLDKGVLTGRRTLPAGEWPATAAAAGVG